MYVGTIGQVSVCKYGRHVSQDMYLWQLVGYYVCMYVDTTGGRLQCMYVGTICQVRVCKYGRHVSQDMYVCQLVGYFVCMYVDSIGSR